MQDKTRRVAARATIEESNQGLARAWRRMHRSLTSDRGLWASADSSHLFHWKQDQMEDPLRRYCTAAHDVPLATY